MCGGRDRSRPGLLCRLPSRPSHHLFFYDGPISRAVAFERLLDNGEKFADRLMGGFSDDRDLAAAGAHRDRRRDLRPPSPYGEMALAYALDYIETGSSARAHQLRRVPGAHPPDSRSGDHREQLLELRPRRRALAQRLRLQFGGRAGLEPGVARAAAGGARLAARRAGAAFRGRAARASSKIPGRRATTTSTSSSTVA